jgi:hypothetical protein
MASNLRNRILIERLVRILSGAVRQERRAAARRDVDDASAG